jgi:hypothetical protein
MTLDKILKDPEAFFNFFLMTYLDLRFKSHCLTPRELGIYLPPHLEGKWLPKVKLEGERYVTPVSEEFLRAYIILNGGIIIPEAIYLRRKFLQLDSNKTIKEQLKAYETLGVIRRIEVLHNHNTIEAYVPV